MKRQKLHLGVLAIAAMASLLFVPAASASLVGTLDVANCPGDGVNVLAGSIDWLPAGTGTGCIQTGSKTAVLYGPGLTTNLGSAVPGTIVDLTTPAGGTVADFMMFVNGTSTVFFDLTGIGPGVNNGICAATLNPNLASCSIGGGTATPSPFILAPTSTGTTVTLSAFGLAHNTLTPADPNDIWFGAFTTQIANQTPLQIENTILGGGAINSTFSGEFILQAVPEPVSMALIGGGLMALALLRRRSRRA